TCASSCASATRTRGPSRSAVRDARRSRWRAAHRSGTRRAEAARERQVLVAVARRAAFAVDAVGAAVRAEETQAAEQLSVLDEERHVVRAHFEHRGRAAGKRKARGVL